MPKYLQEEKVFNLNKVNQTFFRKSLSCTMPSSSAAGLATDTMNTLMPDSRAKMAAWSTSSDGQPSINTTITRG